MCIELDYNGSGCNMAKAIANALNVNEKNVDVVVMPPFNKIPFRCDWRVVNSCADLVAYVNGELLQLNIV